MRLGKGYSHLLGDSVEQEIACLGLDGSWIITTLKVVFLCINREEADSKAAPDSCQPWSQKAQHFKYKSC